MKAIILAAGKGVRMRPLTEKVPKAMVKLKGKPLLEWNLKKLKEAGIGEVGIVVGYKKEEVEKKYKEEWNGLKITYMEQTEQLGTAHALQHAKDFVAGEEFLLVHCDVIIDAETFREMVERDNKFEEFDVLIAGREVEDPWRYGVLVLDGSKVKEVVEKPGFGEAPSKIINAGLYRFTAKIFDVLEKIEKSSRGEFELPDAIRELIKEGKVEVVMCRGKCFDIGDLDDLKQAEEEIG